MTEEMIQQALDFRNSDLPDRTKIALELAEDFILNHANNVDDAFMDRLKEHFTEDQIVELTIGIGIWDSVHKFNNVFDVPPPVEDGLFVLEQLANAPEDMRHLITHLDGNGNPMQRWEPDQAEAAGGAS